MKALKTGEIFIDDPNQSSYVYLNGDLQLFATIGAPAGSQVDGIDAEDIALGHIDFNRQNNQNTTAIANTWAVSQWVVGDTTDQGDGSANTKITWTWNAGAQDAKAIDGFLIQVFESKTNDVVTFPATGSADFLAIAVAHDPLKTVFHYSHNAAMNLFLAFKITPYRSIGSIKGAVPTTLFGTPQEITKFQAFTTMLFDGKNISELYVTMLSATLDSVIDPAEKQAVVQPYLNKIAETGNSEYANALAKIATAPDFPVATKDALVAARNALYAVLTAVYPITRPTDLTQSTGQSSTLMGGDNWKLTHIISGTPTFRQKFRDYDEAYGAVDLAILLLAPTSTSDAKALVDELADSVITPQEKLQFRSLLKDTIEPNTKDLKLFMVIRKVASAPTKISDLESKLVSVQTELNTVNRLTYDSVAATYTGTEHPILFDVTARSRFHNDAEVTAFFGAINDWYTTFNTYNDLVDNQVGAFRTAKDSWSHTTDSEIKYYHLFDGFIASQALVGTLIALKADVSRAWTQIKARLTANGVTETVTTTLATFNTQLNLSRGTVNLTTYAQGTGTIAAGVTESVTILFATVAEIKTLYDAAVALDTAYSLAHYEFLVLTTDGMIQINAMANDSVISVKEKVSLRSLLNKSKVEHDQMAFDLSSFPAIISDYPAKYATYIQWMETKFYPAVLKGKVTGYYRHLMDASGPDFNRYPTIDGGTTTIGAHRCEKEDSEVNEADFTLMMGEFLYARNVLKKDIQVAQAEAKSVPDYLLEPYSKLTSTIAVPNNLSIVFGTDPDKDGGYTTTVNWDWLGTDTSTISGFIHYVSISSKSAITDYTPYEVYAKKGVVLSDADSRTHEYEIKAKKYVNLYVFAYRMVDKSTYVAATGGKFQSKKTKIYYLVSTVVRFTNSGNLAQVKESYTPTSTPATVPPNAPSLMDYWFNHSMSTQSGILKYSWGQWDGIKYVQVSNRDAIKRLPLDPTDDFTVSQATEPPNNPGFYWENTSTATVGGVMAGAKARFDIVTGLWLWNNSLKHYEGTSAPTTSAPTLPYEGALYLNTANYKLYRARNGKWKQYADLKASEVGSDVPAQSLSVKRFYDKVHWAYYARAKATATTPWIQRNLLMKEPLKTAFVPLPSGD